MQRARQASPEQFDEVFRESTGTLLAELDNLKTILNRFGDFAKMPAPERHPLDLNELVRAQLESHAPHETVASEPAAARPPAQ